MVDYIEQPLDSSLALHVVSEQQTNPDILQGMLLTKLKKHI